MSKVIFSESFCFPDVVNCFPFATASKLWQNNLLANTKKSHMWHNYQSISLLCFVLMHLCLNKIFPCLCKPFLGSYGLVSTPLVASAHAQEPCIAAVLLAQALHSWFSSEQSTPVTWISSLSPHTAPHFWWQRSCREHKLHFVFDEMKPEYVLQGWSWNELQLLMGLQPMRADNS